MKSFKTFRFFILMTAIVASLVGMQCYTTFKHPLVFSSSDSIDVAVAKQVDFLDDCSSCHERNNPIDNSQWQLYDSQRLQDNYNWQYYYVIPWWVDAYYYEDGRGQQNQPLPATQRRDFDRREPAASQAVPASGAPGTGLARPAAGTSSSETPPPEPPPPRRNERREIGSREDPNAGQPANPTPERKKREENKPSGTKKEKE